MLSKLRKEGGYYGPVEVILWVVAVILVIWLVSALID